MEDLIQIAVNNGQALAPEDKSFEVITTPLLLPNLAHWELTDERGHCFVDCGEELRDKARPTTDLRSRRLLGQPALDILPTKKRDRHDNMGGAKSLERVDDSGLTMSWCSTSPARFEQRLADWATVL